jgi:hypothetical protein
MLSSGDNPLSGTLAVTTTPAALGSRPCVAVLVQNDPGSADNALIGDSTHQYFNLKPGQACTIPCSNISQLYAVTASGTATVNFISVQ